MPIIGRRPKESDGPFSGVSPPVAAASGTFAAHTEYIHCVFTTDILAAASAEQNVVERCQISDGDLLGSISQRLEMTYVVRP